MMPYQLRIAQERECREKYAAHRLAQMSAFWSCSGLVDTFIQRDNALWRCQMSRRKRYSEEFKREALRRVNEEGVTDVLVAEELGINARQLRRWRNSAKRHGENAFPGQGNAREKELMRLKRKGPCWRHGLQIIPETWITLLHCFRQAPVGRSRDRSIRDRIA